MQRGRTTSCYNSRVNLHDALGAFDATETTLRRLETVWERMVALIPPGISFVGTAPEGIEYENLRRAYGDLAAGLPALDTWVIHDFPMELDDIAGSRLGAHEVGEIGILVAVEKAIEAPGEAIREYRYRFNRARRLLVRERLHRLVDEVAALLARLVQRVPRNREPVSDPDWTTLVATIREIERLMGSSITRTGRWTDLSRHLGFGQGGDVHDIADFDWPSVLKDIQAAQYDELEPVLVGVEDLVQLSKSHLTGSVSSQLAWNRLDDEGFERLVFNVISDAPGYDNPQWLTHTNAPDRGRDLSVDRSISDSLSGITRHRVIIQCKHWLSRAVSATDASSAAAQVLLWEPPPVDILILATSGRFSADAVAWVETHNHQRRRPTIELWAETHLESLLAQRPYLVTQLGLRPPPVS